MNANIRNKLSGTTLIISVFIIVFGIELFRAYKSDIAEENQTQEVIGKEIVTPHIDDIFNNSDISLGQNIEKRDQIHAAFNDDSNDSITHSILLKMHAALSVDGISQLSRTEIQKIIFSEKPSAEIDMETLNINSRASENETRRFLKKYKNKYEYSDSCASDLISRMSRISPHSLARTEGLTLAQYNTGVAHIQSALNKLQNDSAFYKNIIISSITDTSQAPYGTLKINYFEDATQIAKKIKANMDRDVSIPDDIIRFAKTKIKL